MKLRKKWLISALVIALLIGIFAVFNLDQGSRQKSIVRIGVLPIADSAQAFVALDNGLFEKHGLRVELVKLQGGAPILEALGAGTIDFGFSNLVSLILAREAGLPFFAIAGGPVEDPQHAEHAILVPKDSDVRTINDLRAKTVAINTRRNIDELMVTKLLQKHGMSKGDVKFIEVPFPRMLGVLQTGTVDAVATIEPYVSIGLEQSKVRILIYNYIDVQPRTQISTYVTTEKTITNKPDVVTGFQAAIKEATDIARSNPDAVRAAIARHTQLTQGQLQMAKLPPSEVAHRVR